MTDTTKVCARCKISKLHKDFRKDSNRKSGLYPYCRKCCSEENKQYKKNNPEIIAASKRRDYLRHQEKFINKSREYRLKNPEQGSNWKKNNPEKVREYTHRRRVHLADDRTFVIRKSFITRLYKSPCVVCGSIKRIEMDHVVPLSKGGNHCEGNLQPLCKSCNAAKKDKLMVEFKIYLRNFR